MTRVKLTSNGKPSEPLPNVICVYFCYETEDAIVPVYIGSTVNLPTRFVNHHKREQLKDCYLEWRVMPTIAEANELEQKILNKFKPDYNDVTTVNNVAEFTKNRAEGNTASLRIKVRPGTYEKLHKLVSKSQGKYDSVSHALRLWIQEKLTEELQECPETKAQPL